MVVHSRRLVIALATDAWLAAWRCCSVRTMSSAITPRAVRWRFERGPQRRSAHVVFARAMQHLHQVGVVRVVRDVDDRVVRRPASSCATSCVGAAARGAADEQLVGEAAQVLDQAPASTCSATPTARRASAARRVGSCSGTASAAADRGGCRYGAAARRPSRRCALRRPASRVASDGSSR